MKHFLHYLWTLPQNLLGLLLAWRYERCAQLLCVQRSARFPQVRIVTLDAAVDFSAISLGHYIIISDSYKDRQRIIRHEEGHCVQSDWLGPLYLLVVGLPSIVMFLMSGYNRRHGDGRFADRYYQRWPENQADRLGGVIRG